MDTRTAIFSIIGVAGAIIYWWIRTRPLGIVPTPTQPRQPVSDEVMSQFLTGDRINTNSLTPWFDANGKTVYRHTVPGNCAISTWKALRAKVDQTGYWPVIIGDSENFRIMDEIPRFSDNTTPEEIVTASQSIDLAAWHREHAEPGDRYPEPPRGPWPTDVFDMDFTADRNNFSGRFVDSVNIALVPTRQCWQVPAIFEYGDWNACPPAELHTAIMRDWNQRFGAELVTLAGAVIEMHVPNPPTTEQQAIELALEQYAYCDDIVDQGVGTIEALAASLLNSPVWYFWWD